MCCYKIVLVNPESLPAYKDSAYWVIPHQETSGFPVHVKSFFKKRNKQKVLKFRILALRAKFHYFWDSLYVFSKSWQILKEQEHVIERTAPSEIDPHFQDGHICTDIKGMQIETA